MTAISIHALRVEGDAQIWPDGRAQHISIHALRVEGDARTTRATLDRRLFLSTPSGWRATASLLQSLDGDTISIHALRVEGDHQLKHQRKQQFISIHALRVEGDGQLFLSVQEASISIHALRVEGDTARPLSAMSPKYFYPRPPGGGRHSILSNYNKARQISIHALRVEGDPIINYG